MTVPREIKLTNTLSGKKELLVPRVPGKLSFYSCGPTVYGLIHIGNLRGGLVADMFFRYFQRAGYEVTFVRNYTDVDDKIIKKAKEEGISALELAKKYTLEVEKDYAVSGMLEPTHKTKVTEHMPEIIAMIEKIVANRKGYVAPDGEVLFSIESFAGYGKLSHKLIEDLIAGIRVEVSTKKKNPLDFTLWKPAKPGEPDWASPWGKGRPGWHIECSAMASKWLGDQIDVHHGGEDLIFPHHENEIAQTEAACGKGPFVKYWLHHAFLTLSKEKMSKSLGNVFTARDFLARYNGEVARYMLLSVHYRSPIDFARDTIENTLSALQRFYEAKQQAHALSQASRALPDLRAESLWASFLMDCDSAKKRIDECYANDLNAAGALGELFTLIRHFNRILAEPMARATPSAVLASQALIDIMENDIGGILGVGRMEPTRALKEIERIRFEQAGAAGSARPTEVEILAAIQSRADARKNKDFAQADQIRKDLESKGVLIKDGPSGTTWEYQ